MCYDNKEMRDLMKSVREITTYKWIIKKSEFICTLIPCNDETAIDNIITIVTRYFGGIKLGAGGLTRAYRQSVADALKGAEIVEKFSVPLYKITVDYSYTKKFEHLIKVHHIKCINTEYLDRVSYTCYLENESFLTIIQDLTNNTYTKEYLRHDYIELS